VSIDRAPEGYMENVDVEKVERKLGRNMNLSTILTISIDSSSKGYGNKVTSV
jgi:hypothetical protein